MDTQQQQDADTELLSAYLDQEISPEDRADLERRLTGDSELRAELRRLRRAWELLDDLPPMLSGEYSQAKFSESTMTLVRSKLTPSDESSSASTQQFVPLKPLAKSRANWFPWLTIPAALLAAIALGLWHRNAVYQNQLQQIETAANLSILRVFSDPTVAQSLADFPFFAELAQTDIARNTMPPLPGKTDEISDWLKRLDPRDLELLTLQEQDFHRLPTSRQKLLTERNQTFMQRQDWSTLQNSAGLFAAMMQSLDSVKRSAIQSLPAVEQAARIREEAYFKVAVWYADNFTSADRQEINQWVQDDLQPILEPSLLSSDRSLVQEVFVWLMMSNFHDSQEFANQAELVNTLYEQLSDRARMMLSGVPSKSVGVVIATWVLYAQGAGDATQNPTPEELLAKYKGLPDALKERIDLSDPSQVVRRMSRGIVRERLGTSGQDLD